MKRTIKETKNGKTVEREAKQEYVCGHCGHRGPAYGQPTSEGVSAPWCTQCERNDKLLKVIELAYAEQVEGELEELKNSPKLARIVTCDENEITKIAEQVNSDLKEKLEETIKEKENLWTEYVEAETKFERQWNTRDKCDAAEFAELRRENEVLKQKFKTLLEKFEAEKCLCGLTVKGFKPCRRCRALEKFKESGLLEET